MSTKDPAHVAVRYTGGIAPLIVIFPSTGRKLTVVTGEYLALLPSEASGLEGRPDFDFEPESPTPDPPTPDTEETTS